MRGVSGPVEPLASEFTTTKHADKSQLDWSVNNIAGFYANKSTDKIANIDGAYCH